MMARLLGFTLCGLCAISAAYWMISDFLLRRRMSPCARAGSDPGSLAPVTFLRPIKSGAPDLSARIAEAVSAMRPGDQLVFGVDAHSPGAALCAEICAPFRDRRITVVPCEPGL